MEGGRGGGKIDHVQSIYFLKYNVPKNTSMLSSIFQIIDFDSELRLPPPPPCPGVDGLGGGGGCWSRSWSIKPYVQKNT